MSTTPTDIYDPLAATGQDQVEIDDRQDNLQDADTLADVRDPVPADTSDSDMDGTGDDALDNQTDGDRQLTTDSEALDTILNDSDLGADVAGLDPERERYAAGGADAVASSDDSGQREGYAGLGPDSAPSGGQSVTGGATGLGTGVRE